MVVVVAAVIVIIAVVMMNFDDSSGCGDDGSSIGDIGGHDCNLAVWIENFPDRLVFSWAVYK